MIEPLVSVIMPSYNSSKFIKYSILSVVGQTYTNWELLITDDYSKDNSVELIDEWVKQDCRVKLFRLKKNMGAAAARNVSLDNAKGRFIAFLDSDDIWSPDKLEKQITYMLKYNLPFTFSCYDIMNEEGVKLNKQIFVPNELTYNQYLRNTIIGCLTVVLDKNAIGDFRMPLIKSSHDMALWLLVMKRGFKAFGIKDCLATYRLVSTSNTAKKWNAAKDVWRVYRELECLPIIYSAFCFCCYAVNAVLKRI